MNKTVTINISGIIFHIEEDAFDKLSKLQMICVEYDGKDGDIAEYVKQYGFSVLHKTSENLLLVK